MSDDSDQPAIVYSGKFLVDQSLVDLLKRLLIDDESLELKPYRDTIGKLTIGVGRNLTDCGISEAEALYLLNNDVKRVLIEAQRFFPWLGKMNRARQIVIFSMIFNMGIKNVLEFKNTLAALEQGNYLLASIEMLRSEWAIQLPNRSRALSEIMKTGRLD